VCAGPLTVERAVVSAAEREPLDAGDSVFLEDFFADVAFTGDFPAGFLAAMICLEDSIGILVSTAHAATGHCGRCVMNSLIDSGCRSMQGSKPCANCWAALE
jgi:hypothetical protein